MPLRSPGFLLLASITVAFMAAASAPTPLYPLYQAQWGLSPLAVTVVFGVYAVAVLASLLIVGRLSDHVGRRPVLLAALAGQILSMGLYALADGFASMILARVVQGLATGAAVAAVGAALLDVDRERGAVANSVIVPIGTAAGGLFAGLVVTLLPAPGQLVYGLLTLAFIAQIAGVLRMQETTLLRAGALASLRPRLAVSAAARAPLLRAAPAIIATWAVPGFFGSLGPSLTRNVLDVHSPLAAGLMMFALAGSAGVSVVLSHRLSPRRLTTLGSLCLSVGLVLVTLGLAQRSIVVFFIGVMIAGFGFGAGFQGALRSVLAHVLPAERAGVLSVVFIIAYLAMGLPAMLAGYLVVLDGNLLGTAREFAALIVGLAVLAFAASARHSAAAVASAPLAESAANRLCAARSR